MSPEGYAKLVTAFARGSALPFHPGWHYNNLAHLLISCYQSHSRSRSVVDIDGISIAGQGHDLIYIYDLSGHSSISEPRLAISTTQQLDDYDDETRRKQPGGRLVFFQGYLPPRLINHLGAKFSIDPEFFFRHLDFPTIRSPSPGHFFMHSLPSIHPDIIRIRIPLIISCDHLRSMPDGSGEATPSRLREYCQKQMNEYLANVTKRVDVDPGEAMVRRFSVHDIYHFSIEQIVTIHLSRVSQSWTGMYYC